MCIVSNHMQSEPTAKENPLCSQYLAIQLKYGATLNDVVGLVFKLASAYMHFSVDFFYILDPRFDMGVSM